MANREIIIPKGMDSLVDKFHYAPAVKVGNALYISGQLGRDENLQVIEGAEAAKNWTSRDYIGRQSRVLNWNI